MKRLLKLFLLIITVVLSFSLAQSQIPENINIFVKEQNLMEPQPIRITLEIPEQDTIIFGLSFGPANDCPSGCFYSSALGLFHKGKIGWIRLDNYSSVDPNTLAFYNFDADDSYLFSADFFKQLEQLPTTYFKQSFFAMLIKDEDTPEEGLLSIAEELQYIHRDQYIAELLIDNKKVLASTTILSMISQVPEWGENDYFYKDIRARVRASLRDIGLNLQDTGPKRFRAFTSSCDQPTQSVGFGSEALEIAVRKRLYIPVNDVTCQDMLWLDDLTLIYLGLDTLEGLQHATNLQTLHIQHNDTQYDGDIDSLDISAIRGLTHLQTLFLDNLTIKTLEPLGTLTNLRVLTLSWLKSQNYEVLNNLTNLEELSIYFIPVPNLSLIHDLTRLKKLSLYDNKLHRIYSLKNFTNLTHLSIASNKIGNIDVLSYLVNLEELDLQDNYIRNLQALSALKKLRVLDVSNAVYGNNAITSLDGLQTLSLLEELYIAGNRTRDIEAITTLENLQNIDLSDNKISNIEALGQLKQLSKLDLSNNQISDAFPIAVLTNLEKLDLSVNKLTSLEPLSNLTKLKVLLVGNPEITSLVALRNLPNLNFLAVMNSSLSHLTDIETLEKLEFLWLYNCQLETLDKVLYPPSLKLLTVEQQEPSLDISSYSTELLKLGISVYSHGYSVWDAPVLPSVKDFFGRF
jgi:Leucine-rich repeat (LRR) protein